MDAKKLITATDTQYSGSLLQALNDQRMQGLFCDVTVIVEDRKFRAHKNILSACSTYFHQLFCVAGQVVELNFLRADIFAEILNYIYTAKIVRVKCDMLDELIKSGQLLGVPFIAELGILLSHVKSLSEKGKDDDSDSQSGSDLNFPKDTPSNSTSANKRPETSSFSREDSKDKKVLELKDDDSDDDVIFCSEIVTAGPAPSIKKEALENPTSPPNGKTSSSAQAQIVQNASNLLILKTPSPQILPLTVVNSSASTQVTNGSIVPSAQKQVSSSPVVANQVSHNLSSGATTSLQKHPPPLSNSEPPKLLQSGNVIPIADIILDINNTTGPVSSVSPLKNISIDGSGVQKKQVVTFSPESSSKPGEFKIKISDVVPGSIRDSHKESESRHIMDGKKIITLDTPSEIQGLSTGCKVYANIGEDTYDIVIPIKDEPDDGLSKSDDDDSPDAKRMKVKHDDHYELIVDGRVYYICIVCKRSYVCLTSLRRHFNVHSWEKKYPCRYCERVFPLAEYRTKHEIHHTGERRYQCLTCGSSFINYQVMSSHIKSAHNLDPSGDSKLYRLNPCKTLQIRQYSYVNDPSSSIPVIGEDGIVYDLDPDKPESASEEDNPNAAPKPVNWDDIFLQQSNQNMFKPNTSDGSNEFEFVIPESY